MDLSRSRPVTIKAMLSSRRHRRGGPPVDFRVVFFHDEIFAAVVRGSERRFFDSSSRNFRWFSVSGEMDGEGTGTETGAGTGVRLISAASSGVTTWQLHEEIALPRCIFQFHQSEFLEFTGCSRDCFSIIFMPFFFPIIIIQIIRK